MINRIKTYFLLIPLALSGCIELIEFDTTTEQPKLVVQGFISTKSYEDLLAHPVDPRFFKVRLAWTSRVTNIHDEFISGAEVSLRDEDGNSWNYIDQNNGDYLLIDFDFKAVPGKKYKLEITLPGGDSFESTYQEVHIAPPMGDIFFEEVTTTKLVDVNGEMTLFDIQEIELYVHIPEKEHQQTYVRWELLPSWIYIAPNAYSASPVKTCYITNPNYLDNIILHEDRIGNYNQLLASIPTRNIRLKEKFSLLVRQYSMPENNFTFWNDLKAQGERGTIFDAPPYNIPSNLTANNNETDVVGFFEVLHEDIKRWYFQPSDLSYFVSFDKPCDPIPGAPFIPPADCSNCLNHRIGGDITTQKPYWWQ